MTSSQSFIWEHRKSLKCASEYYNVDSELMPQSAFDIADFRLLIVFPSDVTLKGKSMTRDVINDFIRTRCPNVFVDFCYMPCERDRKLFDKENIPYLVGNITHLDASYYDGIGFSLALNYEGMTAVSMLATCDRCDTPIPLTWSERRNMQVGRVPLIWCGGIAASVNDICFGELGDGRQAFFDFAVLGEIYCEDLMFRYLARIKQYGGFTIQTAIREIWRMSAQEGKWDLYRHIYQPQAYRVTYDSSHTIVENIKIDPDAPDYCVPYRASSIPTDLLGAARTVISGNGSNVNDARVMVASGCSGGGACSFCHEGNYMGRYVEISEEEGVRLAREALRYTASDTFRPWAYNITSISHLLQSIPRWRGMYENVVFNNTRMDDLVGNPDLISAFVADNHHIYAPIEGISDRIRNAFLNKGLGYADICAFFKSAASLPISICKVGFIYTGYEEAQDWAEFRLLHRTIEQSLKKRTANFPLRYKGTLLVHYPHTALYYSERKVARMSFAGYGVLTSPQFRKCLSEGIRIKMNGFKYGTFIEQAILDLGRSLTPWFYTHYIAHRVFVESLRSIRNSTEGFTALQQFINIDTFFASKPIDCITPVSRIRLPNHDSILQKAQNIIKNGLSAKLVRRCLRGFGNMNPACVECGICTSWADKAAILHREIYGGEYVQKPLSKDNKEQTVVRVRLWRNKGYEALNPRHTVYTAISRLLQVNPQLLDYFRGILGYSTKGMSENGEQYPFEGIMVVDVAFAKMELGALIPAYHEVNAQCKSFAIMGISGIASNERVRSTDFNWYKFTADMNPELWEKCCREYTGAILATVKGMRHTLYDPALVAPDYTIEESGKITGRFILPTAYSPWAYLQGIYTGHKISAQKIFEKFQVKCVDFSSSSCVLT